MPAAKKPVSVLTVSSSKISAEKMTEMLNAGRYSPIIAASTAAEARDVIRRIDPDIVIINAPLPDDNGVKLALDLSADKSCGIMLVVKSELFERVSYEVEDSGILTIQKPTSKQMVYQAIKLLTASRLKLKKFEEAAATLQSKMEDIRVVNRAKFILIERLKMSEAEAHRYIEKQAMDTCTKRRIIAEKIIRTYEN